MNNQSPDLTSQTASQFFAERIPEYDSLIRRAVSHYDELTAALLFELPSNAHSILELGCGTGNLTLLLARRFPDASLTVVDGSPEMVETTRQRLTAASPALAARSRFITARFEELSLGDAGFDLVTSALALHHVRDKLPVYRTVHRLLEPGGRFCLADQLRLEDPEAHERHWQEVMAFWHRPGNCTPQEIEQLLAHSRDHDYYDPLSVHLSLLSEAGFHRVDLPWRIGVWSVITASRQAG